MNPARRRWLAAALATPWAASAQDIQRGRTLAFPRDHGAHPGTRTEWWYATGWLGQAAAPSHGFQITFFRSRTGLAQDSRSRFAARQLLFAHAALTDLDRRSHHHADHIARWPGDAVDARLGAAADDTDLRLAGWTLQRQPSGSYRARVAAPNFDLDLALAPTQPLLLQGEQGWSRKGPDERQASHYYSQPQLAVSGRLTQAGSASAAHGRAWLDHEWSDEILHPQARGWDWIGINLFDGSALTVFQLRRADGTALWAGGSMRRAGGAVQAFDADSVQFSPGRHWASAASSARYPVQWTLQTPAGRFEVVALLDAQELDSRASTGAIYWEGLSELRDASGARVGLGYLEMTGYAAPLRLG